MPDAGAHVATPDELTGTAAHSVIVLPLPVAVKVTVPELTGDELSVVVEENDPVAGSWIVPDGTVNTVVELVSVTWVGLVPVVIGAFNTIACAG
ncbi:MAG: hypothetical protein ACYCTE_10425, partial [Acidimicrobiales bacterium]